MQRRSIAVAPRTASAATVNLALDVVIPITSRWIAVDRLLYPPSVLAWYYTTECRCVAVWILFGLH